MADNQHTKKTGGDATSIPLKFLKGKDEWRVGDAFGWEHLFDGFEQFGRMQTKKIPGKQRQKGLLAWIKK